jgi:hypothetical protein
MRIAYHLCLVLVAFSLHDVHGATNDSNVERGINVVTRSLPSGWTIVERKSGEIPWGHHWCDDYNGPNGTYLVAKGVRPVNVEFLGADGKWQPIPLATESVEIWLMPGNYRDSYKSWFCFHRPIQPMVIVDEGPVKVYARPSHIIDSEKRFNEILSKSKGVRSPDSPWNAPESLTWKDWNAKLKEAINKAFAK